MDKPRLRKARYAHAEPYQIGEIPDSLLTAMARLLVHKKVAKARDISGDEFGDIFAEAVEGIHYSSPIGIVDVAKESIGWSIKTVKRPNPYTVTSVRLISGRNSPDYSFSISDPRADIMQTGRAVLRIWNERVEQSRNEFSQLRSFVLVRNFDALTFLAFETELSAFDLDGVYWTTNQSDNLEGIDNHHGTKRFVWQPHGSQFTIVETVPESARRFRIEHEIEEVSVEDLLALIDYDDSWVICE
ncbi:hypothetical protein [Candidatus Poriferisocius sp.]|uniref:hypothetical protein n=1 Tax=Candidatus Poriferisocius sp. TaxID=3101276 RepID=UPI003B594D31